ncbi:MAG: cysteine--tRNA ligase [Alphaproteobacteria bacterium]|nr:cysteine--tRNA ligase [Alphaproteobacteria bacterium]
MAEKLYFYNTMSRAIDAFEPTDAAEVKMYCCGPTVYNYAHIGNLRTYIFEDLLAKTIRMAGYKLKHVMNITDVGHLTSDADTGEDKMLLAAEKEKIQVLDLARKYEKVFFDHTSALRLNRPDVVARATEHIQDMIKFVQKLEEKGYAYFSNGNVYFDTAKFPEYGKLSGQNRSELRHGARVEQDENKRNPSDFVLWFTTSKFANQILQWDSPWGKGYPGWHIECSTMAMKYLGEHLDIHCGGIDHIAVHHENEIAQSEAFLGHTWVNTWMHAAFLQMKDGKMSKSKGEFLTLDTLVEKGYKPEHYKYFCLSSHYKTSANFTFEALDAAKNSYETLINKISELKRLATSDDSVDSAKEADSIKTFNSFMFNDLKTPQALATMWDVLKDQSIPAKSKLNFVEHVDKIFGLSLDKTIKAQETEFVISDDMAKIVEQRQQARTNKDWAKSDELRDLLLANGIGIKDLPNNQYQLFAAKKSD